MKYTREIASIALLLLSKSLSSLGHNGVSKAEQDEWLDLTEYDVNDIICECCPRQLISTTEDNGGEGDAAGGGRGGPQAGTEEGNGWQGGRGKGGGNDPGQGSPESEEGNGRWGHGKMGQGDRENGGPPWGSEQEGYDGEGWGGGGGGNHRIRMRRRGCAPGFQRREECHRDFCDYALNETGIVCGDAEDTEDVCREVRSHHAACMCCPIVEDGNKGNGPDDRYLRGRGQGQGQGEHPPGGNGNGHGYGYGFGGKGHFKRGRDYWSEAYGGKRVRAMCSQHTEEGLQYNCSALNREEDCQFMWLGNADGVRVRMGWAHGRPTGQAPEAEARNAGGP